MKIALFHNLLAGGAKRALYEHVRHLRARGYRFDAFLPSTAVEAFLPLAPLCESVRRYEVPGAASSFSRRLLSIPVGRAGGRLGRAVAADLREAQTLHREFDALERVYVRIAADINAGGYDLAYVHHCARMLSPALLRALKVPSVYFCQDTLRHVYEWSLVELPDYDRRRGNFYLRKGLGTLRTRPRLRFLERAEREFVANTRAATVVLANSWYSREAILRTTGVNARVCYLGVDSEFFCPDPSLQREPMVLSVGSFWPSKRHDFIIEALAAIPAPRRPRLEIIGYEVEYGTETLGPLARQLLCLAEEKGVDLRIHKEVGDEALRDRYRRASVVAFAPYLEPFGFVPLEAMACGAPVVGVSEGGLRESVRDGETGLLTHRDSAEFGAAVESLLTDPARAATLGAKGREDVRERWSWERSVDTLERCFQKAGAA